MSSVPNPMPAPTSKAFWLGPVDLRPLPGLVEKTPENLNRSLEVLANMSEADPVGTRHLFDSMPPGQFPFHEWSKRWERN